MYQLVGAGQQGTSAGPEEFPIHETVIAIRILGVSRAATR